MAQFSFLRFRDRDGAASSFRGSSSCAKDRRTQGFRCDIEGVVAIEFALIAPLLIFLVFGVYAASVTTATVNGLEQITAGAARSAVAGLSDSERATLAATYVASNASAYPYIDPTALQLSTTADTVNKRFTVSITYSTSGTKLYQILNSLVPVFPATLRRQAVILEGGS